MTTLKTLKDLRCIKDEEFSCCGGDKSKHDKDNIWNEPWTSDNDLKAEAIKWVKEWKKQDKKVWDMLDNTSYRMFMDFFNLTDEDLQ